MAAAESTVWTWGRAKNYRLGRAFVGTDARVPEKVTGFESVAVQQAACGGGHTAVVLADSRLFVFGYSQYGQLGLGDRNDVCDASQVILVPPGKTNQSSTSNADSSSNSHSHSHSHAHSHGHGHSHSHSHSHPPTKHSRGAAAREAAATTLPVAEVACGRYHTIARTECGLVFTWGGGKNGRLGHGDEKIRAQPTCVESLCDERAISVTAGYHNNLVLSERGQVWSWGWGAHGQLGLGDTRDRDVPTVIEELSRERVHLLSCGDRHSFAVTEEGRVFGWGSNEFGQLGGGRKRDTVLRPKVVEGLLGLMVVGISSGDRHSAAVTNTGAVYTWGCGSDGQCGHGTFGDAGRPKLVEGLIGKFVVDVKCGHNFTIVMTSNKEVFSWGNNTYGQLGNNGNGKSESPVRVMIGSAARVARVSCAHFHCIMWMETDASGGERGPRFVRRDEGTSVKKDVSKQSGDGGEMDQARSHMEEARQRLAGILREYEEKREECRVAVERERKTSTLEFEELTVSQVGR